MEKRTRKLPSFRRGRHKTLFGFAAVFFPVTSEYPLEIHKVFLQGYSLLQRKIQAAKLRSTSKPKILISRQAKILGQG